MTLSRYSKIMGEVSDSEAVDMIAKKLLKHGVSVPFNTVTPSLREALVERGVQITEPEKKTGKECAEAYEAWKSEKAVKKTGDVRLHLSVLKKLKDIINKSIEGEIHASYIKDEYDERRPENGLIENQLVHRIFGAASFGGKVYVVKTTVIEERGGENRAYTYEVTDAEIELAATDATTKAEPMGLPHIGTANLL